MEPTYITEDPGRKPTAAEKRALEMTVEQVKRTRYLTSAGCAVLALVSGADALWTSNAWALIPTAMFAVASGIAFVLAVEAW